ncbi:hypothetical protein GBA52_025031 [Prunus armeniaca]|nr:hypothetical protein GBA52_025031 [Prunus armeniaca]
MYTKIFHGNREQGNWPTTCAIKSARLLGKSLSDACVLSTSTRKYLKPTVNGETGQPPVQSYRAGGEANHARRTSSVMHMYTKLFKGNLEQGNWPTNCAVKSSRWLEKSLSDTCVLSTGTHTYLKPTMNGETSQPPASSYRAGGCGNHARRTRCVLHMYMKILKGNSERGNWPTTCAVKSGRWLGKSLPDPCVLSTGTHKYLKPTERGNWPTTCAVISGKWLGKSCSEN